ncbi:MAG TPA: TrmH family RNA methyltransferase [Nautiliaceae bacterium]|nr:TrmH family RNA methyltransferase [Nautiliaceae bacterium]
MLFENKKEKELKENIKRIKKIIEEKGINADIRIFEEKKIFRIEFPLAILAYNYTKEPNLVTLLRTAEAFGAKEFITIGVKPEITQKISVGAKKWIKWQHFNEFDEVKDYLQKNYKLVALEISKKSIPIFEVKKYPEPVCFIIGSEKTEGVPEEIQDICDLVVRIPQYGVVGSLNTATAGSILLFDYIQKNIKIELLNFKSRNYRV